MGVIHLVFAAVTFIALGLMALRFAKSARTPGGQDIIGRILCGLGLARLGDDDRPARKKRKRRATPSAAPVASRSCPAWLSNLLPQSVKADWPLLFIFEALAVFAFGVSWFVKGQTLLPSLKDKP